MVALGLLLLCHEARMNHHQRRYDQHHQYDAADHGRMLEPNDAGGP